MGELIKRRCFVGVSWESVKNGEWEKRGRRNEYKIDRVRYVMFNYLVVYGMICYNMFGLEF